MKASRDSTLIDDIIRSTMVLARGVGDAIGWMAKALGWIQELWREKAVGITFPLAPCLCCYSLGSIHHPMTKMFAWVGGGALPHHVNVMGQEATSPATTGY